MMYVNGSVGSYNILMVYIMVMLVHSVSHILSCIFSWFMGNLTVCKTSREMKQFEMFKTVVLGGGRG